MYRISINTAWFTVMAINLVFMSTWPRPKADEFAALSYGWVPCNQWWRLISDFLKYGLVHRDGNNLGNHVYLTTAKGYKKPNNNSLQQIHQPCNQWYFWMKSDLSFFEFNLAHRDGNNHSSKSRIVACSANLILSNLPSLVNCRLPRRSLLFALVFSSRDVSEFC